MGIIQTIAATTFVYSAACVAAALIFARLCLSILLHPTRLFWKVKRRDTVPACLTDPAYGIHGYLPIEGVKIHYVEKGDRSKPLMLFIHGFPEFWYSWRHQLKEFSKDYWTVAVDMRGYGDSDKPAALEDYKMAHLVNDIKEIIEALGHETCTLVAHDFGGAIAWNFVMTHPEMLDSYIILDAPYSPSNFRILTSNLFQVLMSWDLFYFQLPYLPELTFRAYDMVRLKHLFRGSTPTSLSPITDEDLEAYKYAFAKSGAFTPPINYFRANGFSLSPPKSKLKKDIEAPGLYMFGEHDGHLVFDHLWAAQSYIKNLKVQMVKGANHYVQQDDPEKVNGLIRDFLKTKKPKVEKPVAASS
ncbi:Epoxide hydrolase 4 [Cryptotermes secundus]|uniref:Epoxide hydrolase 4 n=1 Tax=Cryptotermes secundus TaxID=105785 RepID=A0A2J7R388_9NEOP|nr:epoxide hydrolase 4 [Cryptotermes secundus]PNF35311.1 Epoxide hydrolase 4 [Cryptotermes secundus]